MRIFLLAILLTIVGIIDLHAQRFIAGQKGLELNTGLLAKDLQENHFINLALIIQSKHGNYWIWGAEYTKQNSSYKSWQLPIETYTAEMGYSLQVLSDPKKVISLNAGIIATGGYETINGGNENLRDGGFLVTKDNFIYGAGGRLSLETYLSDRFVLLLQGRTKIMWGTDLKQFRPSTGIGVRFNF